MQLLLHQIDLRTSKCMPAVQDQASCGSCWAFSTIHNIDYRHCVKHDLAAPITFRYYTIHDLFSNKFVRRKKLFFFTMATNCSPQNLVDCSTSNSGCNGGDQVVAYEDIIKDMPSGVMTSAEYPYKARVSRNEQSLVRLKWQLLLSYAARQMCL